MSICLNTAWIEPYLEIQPFIVTYAARHVTYDLPRK